MNGLIVAFFITTVSIIFLKKIAWRLKHVDVPGGRKAHTGDVPLVGGLAMFIGFVAASITFENPSAGSPSFNTAALLMGATLLVIIGMLDDRGALSVKRRLCMQAIAAMIMVIGGGLALSDLGRMFFDGVMMLGIWTIPITIIATVGSINAMNMSDGVDGLAGSLALVTLVALAFLAWYAGSNTVLSALLAFIGVVTAFLVFNLRAPWRGQASIFMGDAGSMFLGFALAWHMALLSQGEQRAMTPVTALWIFALPLFDMVCTMLRRMYMGRSPFSSDRVHLHHLLKEAGLSDAQTVKAITLLAGSFAIIGVGGYLLNVPEWLMFYGFIGLFALYTIIVELFWRDVRNRQPIKVMKEAGSDYEPSVPATME